MLLDPLYILFMLPCLVLSALASWKVKATFKKYSQRGTSSRMTGADIASAILQKNGIFDVGVELTQGMLSDHYDPRGKKLRLSHDVYYGNSMASFGVAAHEVGHAIQHAKGYAPLKFRSAMVPLTQIGSNLSWVILSVSLIMGAAQTPAGSLLAWVGITLFATTTVFTLVTLPVEFDASSRALAELKTGGYVSPDELKGAKKVLDAAALTYVAAAITAVVTLLYWAIRLGLLGGSRDD